MDEQNRSGKKWMRLRGKVIAVIIPVVMALVVVFFIITQSMIMRLIRENIERDAEVYSQELDGWTQNILNELDIYKTGIEEGGFSSDEEILRYMKTSYGVNDAYPQGLYMGDDAGVYLDASGWVPDDEDWVLTERDWYVEGLTHKEFAFGEPYFDSLTKTMCVSATTLVDYPSATRVLSADVYLDYLSELVDAMAGEDIDITFFVTGQTDTILAHSDPEMVNVTLSDSDIDSLYANIAKMLGSAGSGGMEKVRSDSGAYFVSAKQIENTDWYLVTAQKRMKALGMFWIEGIILIMLAAAAAVILILLISRLVNHVVKPVSRVAEVLNEVSNGNFSQDVEVVGYDEIAVMSRNMQNFLTEMRKIIRGLSRMALRLQGQAQENEKASGELLESFERQDEVVKQLQEMTKSLADASDTAKIAVEQLSGSRSPEVEKISQMIEEQSEKIERITVSVDDLAQDTEKVSQNSTIVAENATKLGEESQSLAEDMARFQV